MSGTQHVTVGGSGFTTKRRRESAYSVKPEDYVRTSDLFNARLIDDRSGMRSGTVTVYGGYAMSAARIALRGAAWSEDDRAECAGWVAGRVMGAVNAARHGSPREVLAWVAWCERFPTLARRAEESVPRRLVTMANLSGHAGHWRRSEIRRRDRDDRAARADAVTRGFSATQESMADETYAPTPERALRIARSRVRAALPAITAHPTRAARVLAYIDAAAGLDRVQLADADGAHVTARATLGALGLPRMGRAYPAAYLAAASTDGAPLADVAAVLGCRDADALRLKSWRARKAIPSANRADWPNPHPTLDTGQSIGDGALYLAHADLVGVTCETDRVHHGVKVSDGDWRDHDRSETCTCVARKDRPETDPTACPDHPMATGWTDEPTAGHPAWTIGLPPSTAARLAEAARLRDKRAAAKRQHA